MKSKMSGCVLLLALAVFSCGMGRVRKAWNQMGPEPTTNTTVATNPNWPTNPNTWTPPTNASPVVTNTIPEAPMPEVADAIDPNKIDYRSGTPANKLKITKKILSARFNGDGIDWKDSGRSDWKRSEDGRVNGDIALYFEHDGKIIGGVFDALKPGQYHKDLFNIHVIPGDPKKPGRFRVEPVNGQKCWICVQSWHGVDPERTQIFEVQNGYMDKK